MNIWSECIADRGAAGLAIAGRNREIGARHSATKRGIEMDEEYPDVTSDREHDLPSWEAPQPYVEEDF